MENQVTKSTQITFEDLYTEHYEKLCTYLLNYSSDKEKIEDIVQDTFTSFWAKRNEIEISSSLKSYLYRSAYHKLIDTVRENKKTNSMLESYYYNAINTIEKTSETERNLRLEKLERCIEKLPSKCKQTFVASKISGKKYQEIADEFDISLKTVEGHISKGYKLLKECVSKK